MKILNENYLTEAVDILNWVKTDTVDYKNNLINKLKVVYNGNITLLTNQLVGLFYPINFRIEDVLNLEQSLYSFTDRIDDENKIHPGLWKIINDHMRVEWKHVINKERLRDNSKDYDIVIEHIFGLLTIVNSINEDNDIVLESVSLLSKLVDDGIMALAINRELKEFLSDNTEVLEAVMDLCSRVNNKTNKIITSKLYVEKYEVYYRHKGALQDYMKRLAAFDYENEANNVSIPINPNNVTVNDMLHDFDYNKFLHTFKLKVTPLDDYELSDVLDSHKFDTIFKAYDKFQHLVDILQKGEEYFTIFKADQNKDVFYIYPLNRLNSIVGSLVTIIKKKEIKEYDMKTTVESLNIDKDGNIKISIDKKEEYMDLYEQNHKLLVVAKETDNLDMMKKGVATAYALIKVLEHDQAYKKDKKKEKARMFLINDFKTYLKYILAKEPTFDFASYYASQEYDKYIIEITPETISGIKSVVRALLI